MSEASPLLVVGSVALDSVRTGQGERVDALGGSASYFSLAAVRYCPVRLVAVVGADFPSGFRQLYDAQGVDTAGLQIVEGKTFRWGGVYSEDMNDRETLFTELNVFEEFHPVLPDAYRQTPIVLLANIDPVLQKEVVDQMESPQLVALDTMNFWIESRKEELVSLLTKVDLFFLNEEEARQLTGYSNTLTAAKEIMAMGPKMVVIKRGEYGSLCLTSEGWFALPAFPVENLTDPTGAGDTFAGGVLGYLSQRGGDLTDGHLRRAVAHGTAIASHTVASFSVDGLLDLGLDQIESRVRDLWDVTQFGQRP